MSVIVSTDRLNAAIKLRLEWGKRTLPQICNTSAYYVARNAAGGTPFTSIDWMDTELGTIRVSEKTGKTLKGTKGKGALRGAAMGKYQDKTTLAKLIILARANIVGLNKGSGTGSFYNQSTNNRYALNKDDLKGKGTILGMISRMIKSRHSSSKFLRSGWVPAIKTLEPYAFKRGGAAPVEAKTFKFGNRGSATPAVNGSWEVSCMIENATGLEGKNAANFNQALLLHGIGPLQAAIAQEEAGMVAWMETHQKPANDVFNAMCV